MGVPRPRSTPWSRHAGQIELLRDGRALGPLHGVPVGIKDIFDTADMPTENGTVLHAGRRPTEDAMVVALLRQAGAILLGKTVTTELAVYRPRQNPEPPRSAADARAGPPAGPRQRWQPTWCLSPSAPRPTGR